MPNNVSTFDILLRFVYLMLAIIFSVISSILSMIIYGGPGILGIIVLILLPWIGVFYLGQSFFRLLSGRQEFIKVKNIYDGFVIKTGFTIVKYINTIVTSTK